MFRRIGHQWGLHRAPARVMRKVLQPFLNPGKRFDVHARDFPFVVIHPFDLMRLTQRPPGLKTFTNMKKIFLTPRIYSYILGKDFFHILDFTDRQFMENEYVEICEGVLGSPGVFTNSFKAMVIQAFPAQPILDDEYVQRVHCARLHPMILEELASAESIKSSIS